MPLTRYRSFHPINRLYIYSLTKYWLRYWQAFCLWVCLAEVQLIRHWMWVMWPWVHIQKEVIYDLKRENQFLSKEIWESIWVISRKRFINQFSNWILRRVPLWSPRRVQYSGRREIGGVYLIFLLECIPQLFLVMVDRVKGEGRAPPALTRIDWFSCNDGTRESHCHSVYSVRVPLRIWTLYIT